MTDDPIVDARAAIATSPHVLALEHTFHAPTGEPPAHTVFLMLVCARCRGVQLLPASNYGLTTPSFQRDFERLMQSKGYTWCADPESCPETNATTERGRD